MRLRRVLIASIGFVASLVWAGAAYCACGSAFCPITTEWDVRGVWTEPGGRFELRYEYIDQDQPRAGSRKVGVGEVPGGEHDEVYTVNRNWIATLDYNFSREWGLSLIVPLVDRSHGHIGFEDGEQVPESWNFSKPGDVRVLGRYTFPALPERPVDLGLSLGVKLPTGSTDVRNAQGELAEPSLQPGTGTTDLIAGGFLSGGLAGSGDSWFAQAAFHWAIDSNEGYRPGSRFLASGGWRHPFSESWAGLLQVSYLNKGRDSGFRAEPADSGGTFVSLNPGVSLAATRGVQLFAYVQVPLYQYVNGVQLTADWAGVLGVATRF